MADDDESLDEILSTPIKPAPEAEPEVEKPSEPDHGRFAPKGDQEPEVTAEQPEEGHEADDEHNAPVASVVAERRKRQEAQAERDTLRSELSELKGQMSVLLRQREQPAQPTPQPEPVKPIELWDDPNKFIEQALDPFQQKLSKMTFRASRAEAIAEHGKEAVTAAQQALEAEAQAGRIDGKAVADRLRKSDDPVGDIVRWHQNSPAVQETTLREKLRAELMAEFGIDPNNKPEPSTPSPRNPIVKMPPSLNRIPAGHSAPERDESLDEVLSVPRRRA